MQELCLHENFAIRLRYSNRAVNFANHAFLNEHVCMHAYSISACSYVYNVCVCVFHDRWVFLQRQADIDIH